MSRAKVQGSDLKFLSPLQQAQQQPRAVGTHVQVLRAEHGVGRAADAQAGSARLLHQRLALREGGGEREEGPLAEVHETAVNLLYVLIVLHIAGVVFETRRSGRRIVLAMLPWRR